jgi:hypothetical protein
MNVSETLRLLREGDKTKLRELRETIQAGIDQLESGEYTEYDPANVKALAVAVRDRGRRRLTCLRKSGTR